LKGKDTFENSARSALKQIGFTTLGYYSYPARVDIVGYLDPPAPLKNPFKVVATILKGETTEEQIQNSSKLVEDSRANRLLIFSRSKKSNIQDKVVKFIESIEAECFDSQDIDEIMVGATSKEPLTELDKLSPQQYIKYLPEFSRQKIPFEITAFMNNKVLAWQLFEHSVFSIFHYTFVHRTKMLGSNTLFKNEPEGEVITSQKFGLLYECKSSSSSYKMTSEDQAIYEGYIQSKKSWFDNYYSSELQYFVIISPAFSGDIQSRRDEINRKTNVLVIFLEADLLKTLAYWVSKMDNNLKKEVDLGKIFKISEPKVESTTVSKYIEEFDSKAKKRY
jgi:hypothetical protein